jgi:pimeloyl-ACP methyl ester carboxylesterase
MRRAFPVRSGITLWRVVYRTLTSDGRSTHASGLLALPRGAPRALVSWQHGTTSLRRDAPSAKARLNGILPAAAFAGGGYALVAPDYVGFGVSDELHDYYLADHMAQVVRDFIDASFQVLQCRGAVPVSTRLPLLLAGFSQGGHATLATQRLLERQPLDGLALTASASIAGPIDLAGAGLRGALAGNSLHCSLYLAWLATTYARAYDEDLATALRPEYADIAPRLFDGNHGVEATLAALPSDPRELFTEACLDSLTNSSDHWLRRGLHDNGLLDWAPGSATRLYYGTKDSDVTIEQAECARRSYARTSTETQVIEFAGADHDATLRLAAPLVRRWFDELTRS